MKLRVGLFCDEETGYWGYEVPALSIIGTGCKSREDAERLVLDAIEFTFDSEYVERGEGVEELTLDVQIAKTG